jgi:hypothetical protein
VKQYLDKKGGDRRLVFLADEVGQFIGGQSQLMLNLQTITENLGTVCDGRAWVVVTSQEDIEAVVGGAFEKDRSKDFSKIRAVSQRGCRCLEQMRMRSFSAGCCLRNLKPSRN